MTQESQELPEKIEISKEAYLAAHLYSAQQQLVAVRLQLLQLNKIMLEKDETILTLERKIFESEEQALIAPYELEEGCVVGKDNATNTYFKVLPS